MNKCSLSVNSVLCIEGGGGGGGWGGGLLVILTAYFDETKNVIPSSQWGSIFWPDPSIRRYFR